MEGLTSKEVEERIKNGQVNHDAGLKTKTVGQIVLENSCTLFNLVNVLLAVCLFLVQSYRNMLFIGVVLSNLLIGIVQELRAKYVMDKLSLLAEAHVPVVRDGREQEVSLHEIVKDDLIHLKSGMQICADAVVVEGECEVNESLLTGESVSIGKQKGDSLLSGSFLVSGSVYAKVQKVGEESYVNQIASSAKYMKKVNSEIKSSVMKIIKMVSIAIFPTAILLFLNQMTLNGASLQNAVVNTVAALLGMIPEGLVLLTSVVMAVSVVRLARKKTLVQQMYCVETLARVDVFCLDKTGTLTEGTMRLVESEALSELEFDEALAELMGAMKEGNATFEAINQCYHKEEWTVKEVIPFSSERKWSGAVFENQGIYVLGAPEFVLSSIEPDLQQLIENHTANGERVLLFAHTNQQIRDKKLPDTMLPLAFLYIEDIIKESAPKTIAYLKKQNVELKIISGDNPKAVSDIARRVGIANAEHYVDCSVLENEKQLKKAAETNTVFGRVSPQQKQLLVQTLKKKHTVAMTGDGVNDVLALKESDCSIAMQNGSEAARNVSDVVLLNSDFVSIPAMIAEGRRAINNLQRSSSLFLVKTVFSVILALIFCFLNRKYPYQPIQMSLISSICIGIPSFILALEPNYDRVTPGFLRKVFRIALPGGLLMAINILVCVALGNILHITAGQVSTLTTIMAGCVFAVILFKICYPFDWLRRVLYIGLIVLFCLAVCFAGPVFYFKKLSLECFLVIGILEGVNVVIFNALQKLIVLVMEYHLKRQGKSTGVEIEE
ncbi:MAG: HAD-IC family P-type ATPase [Lachnospiraceae bacterium]|nr:HAD-IC family P-type ATPase [Lachnospiraceae bacterium]